MLFVETRVFTRRVLALMPEEHYRALQLLLLGSPREGALIPGSGGLRKLRWSGSGRGKRGGLRIIYFFHESSSRVLLLLVYPKAEQDDLTPDPLAALRRITDLEY